jgi:hypothetical protein
MGTPTSQTTATLSLWVKRSGISKTNFGDSFWDAEASNYNLFGFAGTGSGNTDSLLFTFRSGGTYYSNAVYRDPSAWYHIVCVYDSTNATQADRFRFFVNGVRGTFISSPAFALNYTFEGSIGAGAYRIGDFTLNSSWRPDFYLAEYYWIDGQALSPSSFGETDAITGRWKAKAYSGTYGNNGFYIKFADNSGTTLTTLGKDSSPNGNNWTPNNFSVTAGTGNDSLVDSPTNYGSDTGVGGTVRGNYATFNPLSITSGSFVQGNLRYTGPSGWRRANGTIAVSSGKWYWEVTLGNAPFGSAPSESFNAFGWGLSTVFASSTSAMTITDAVILADSQHYKNFSGSATSLGTSFSSGDVLGCAVDLGANTFTFYRNGSQLVTGTIGGTSGRELVPIIISYDGTYGVMDCNFGQRPFAYTAPTGFKALCTQNLTTPTIKKPSSYFDALAYTGTGASNSISSLGFSPDLVWIKSRGGATSHAIYDTSRGIQAQLSSDTTDAEVTSSTGLTAFGSNGFTVGTSTLVNTSGTQYVAWAWDEAPMAGMDIVSFTGTGATQNVSHNLGVAPKMVIYKCRNTAVTSWVAGHSSVNSGSSPWNYYLVLNATDAQAASSAAWNNTAPTSAQFTVGGGFTPNTFTYIAYCFAEIEGFSKFGSYTGNGSADGPFVYCGFRPRWVMVKMSSSTGDWYIFDTARDSFNATQLGLLPNSSQADGTYTGWGDVTSNGFKIRRTDAAWNTSGGTYIFAAFAESPFKYARAR